MGVQGLPNYWTSNVVFYDNLIHDNYGTGFLQDGGSGNLIYNNTLYNNELATASVAEISLINAASSNVYENNIIYGSPGATLIYVAANSETGEFFDFNDYYGGSANPLNWGGTAYNSSGWQTSAAQDPHSLNSNPLLTSPGATLTLQPGSPAIGAGANLGSAYQSVLLPSSVWPMNVAVGSQPTSWSIGAYLYVAPD
jgi:parallel beta-helix repeat protein